MISYTAKQNLKKTAMYLLLAMFLFAFTVEGSVGVFPYGLIVMIIATSISGLIAALLHGKFIYARTLLASRIILFTGLLIMITAFTFYKIQINQNFKNAAILVGTIDNFKKDNGDYPRDIQALVPKYIKKIPTVKVGIIPRNFNYEYLGVNHEIRKLDSQDTEKTASGYFLIYKGYLGVTYTYYSREGSWRLVD